MASLFSDSLRAFLKPILPYLDDPAVTEIMINGPENVWIEKQGKLFHTEARFTEEGVMAAARNLAQFVGRPISEERPQLDARLPDGSRVHIVLPPVARTGATIAIRKFFQGRLSTDKLVRLGAMTTAMQRFLEAVIALKLNVIVSGGTGSGKTTLLNAISTLVPPDERVLTIEDSAELQLHHAHLVSFETRPPDKYGKGEIDMASLLRSALRLRPDRIIVGEVRGGECFTLLQAMNTGHGGSLATAHANTPVDTLRRLESLALMSTVEMPLIAVRAQVAAAIHLVVTCERLQDGSRKVLHIAEVLPLDEHGEYRTQDLFTYTQERRDADGRVIGQHAPTGALPSFLGRLAAFGFSDIDERFFDPIAQGLTPPRQAFTDSSFRVRWVKSVANGRAIETPRSGLNGRSEIATPAPPPPKVVVAPTPIGVAAPRAAPNSDGRLPTAARAEASGPGAVIKKPAPVEATAAEVIPVVDSSEISLVSEAVAEAQSKASPKSLPSGPDDEAPEVSDDAFEEDQSPVQEERTDRHAVPEGFEG